MLKCEVHSVLVMRKRFWRSWRSVAVVSWTSSSSVCVCFNAKADLAILAFGHCVFFASFCFVLQLPRSLVCAFVCSFLQLYFCFNVCSILCWWVGLSELSTQFQVVSWFTDLTAISLPESLPFPGEALWGIAR